ncbi:hypothetical protein [Pedobacter sandarakinus]|uniref:hypothetical protein n=1 Tax=Pedobacter sandarakinus TaxID=353156 RepID=UPI0022466EF0|nr:hypothetical protein [Pedobacter sandarakinus]MCX2573380.1 hypothetical protein [Pedobacter sandarakinus]
MAVLHKKEEKIQAVLGRLSTKYTDEQFVEMFIKLYSKDWGKIKSAYIKQSQDKEPGTLINMPKPEIYLKQVLANYLNSAASTPSTAVSAEKQPAQPEIEVKAAKAPKKEKATVVAAPKKTKTTITETATEAPAKTPTRAKAPAKKKVADFTAAVDEPTKVKAVAKKTTEKK